MSHTALIVVRKMTLADLEFAHTVRHLAGWNQTLADWERFLRLAPDGCFVAERNGVPVGTATTTVYGLRLAWIGMVLVHPESRRLGIGTTLLRHCLSHLEGRGIECIGLDATPAGRPVYERNGFRSAWTLTRWEKVVMAVGNAVGNGADAEGGGRGTGMEGVIGGTRVRPLRATDWAEAVSLDASAMGVARPSLITALIEDALAAVVAENAADEMVAWGLVRQGARAFQMGPVVSATPAAGTAVMDQLLEIVSGPVASRVRLAAESGKEQGAGGSLVFCDIPDAHEPAVRWAEARGFTRQRSLTRMYRGGAEPRGDGHRMLAIAGPETG